MASTTTTAPVSALPAERFFRVSLSLLIFTSMVSLSSTGKLDLIAAVLGPAAALFKAFRWWMGRPAELSNRAATWCLAGYLAFFPVDALFLSRFFVGGSSNPPLFTMLLAVVHFLIFAMLVRFYSAATDRDALFLGMLSFAAILASAILTVDTLFLLLFFIFLLFAVSTFLGMELRRGAMGAVSPAPNVYPERDRKLNRALSFASLSVAVGAILLGCTLFFFFPRFSAGYLGRVSFSPSLMTGFTENVELGQIGEIKKDTAVVMRVQTGKPIGYDLLRWRGIALTNFDGKRWTSATRNPQRLQPGEDGWIYTPEYSQKSDGSGQAIRYTVFLEPLATDAIFVPGRALSLKGNFTGETTNTFTGMRRMYILRDATETLFNPFRNFSAVRYVGSSFLPMATTAKLRTTPKTYPAEITATYLQLPPLDPRIPALAREITRNATTPFDKAIRIENYLRSRYAYSLNLTGKPGDDPLAHFLFETKAGHCEYFASSMAIMLRTLGIPSREVNGFLPGEYNDLGGDYIVRASDAHSWVEVYFTGLGWQVFDPTPGGPERTPSFLTRLALYMDWMEITWNEWVIGYDFTHQLALAQNLQHTSKNWGDGARAWFDEKQRAGKRWLKSWELRHGTLGYLLPVVLVLLLVALRYNVPGELLRRARLFLQIKAAPAKRSDPQLASRLYAELLRMLARRGLIRTEAQTPFEFAAAMDAPQVAPAVQEFTQLYAHARFGGAPCNATRLGELLEEVRSALRAN
ncbi:MAG TPA: transglutaminaseTgpA domain-containing protein [Candidatus Acidoferrum sp.]|nr:transglutaminaseTgpA domain-containing protein [Candidatus Acidoferrum sp.]